MTIPRDKMARREPVTVALDTKERPTIMATSPREGKKRTHGARLGSV